MLDQTTIKLGDDEFVLMQFPTSVALKYAVQVGRIFGTMIAGGFDGVDLDDSQDIMDQLDISKMLTGLLSQMHDERTPALIKNMLKDSIVKYVNEEGLTTTAWDNAWYESRFAGKLGDMAQLLMVVLTENFADVLTIAKKKFKSARPPTQSKSLGDGTGANGSHPGEEPESTGSFFGP